MKGRSVKLLSLALLLCLLFLCFFTHDLHRDLLSAPVALAPVFVVLFLFLVLHDMISISYHYNNIFALYLKKTGVKDS